MLAAGVLRELARSESDIAVAAARALFPLGLVGALLLSAVLFASASSNPKLSLRPTHEGWWAFAVGGAIPMTLLAMFAAWPAYRGAVRRLALGLAAAAAAGEYLLLPVAYVPPDEPLHGLGLFVHRHHLLVVLALLAPGAVVAAADLRRRRAEMRPA